MPKHKSVLREQAQQINFKSVLPKQNTFKSVLNCQNTFKSVFNLLGLFVEYTFGISRNQLLQENMESRQKNFWCAHSIAPPFFPIQCLPEKKGEKIRLHLMPPKKGRQRAHLHTFFNFFSIVEKTGNTLQWSPAGTKRTCFGEDAKRSQKKGEL